MNIFEKRESNVRNYCRTYGGIFDRAKNSIVYSSDGKKFIDFFAGAGALNYGHNNSFIKSKIVSYVMSDRIMHALDFHTVAKGDFIKCFYEKILKPKGLNYKFQFCGPTGADAVEAALKLARKIKKRSGIFAFMGGYHGVSLGALSVTGNKRMRGAGGVPLNNVTFIPYCNKSFNSIEYMEMILKDSHSGIETPAAVIVETIQAEGGVNVARVDWLEQLKKLCEKYDMLFICDDIQVGCGRSGNFFSFERSRVIPDIVVLSKAISGYGLPMSVLLVKPELDVWQPGEHVGTFRGFQLAFVGAVAALEYRERYDLENKVKERESFIRNFLEKFFIYKEIEIRGLGMIWGIDFGRGSITKKIVKKCFDNGLIIESAGRNGSILKLLPPLNISMSNLRTGCVIIEEAVIEVMGKEE